MTERLTTLAAVKEWLGITTDSSDASLTRLIDAASQFTLNWINRDSFALTTYTQNFKGNGKATQLLRNWPVVSVSSVGTGGSLIPASDQGIAGFPGSGYTLSDPRNAPQSIDLHGYVFYYGTFSQVIYEAGFRGSQVFTLAEAGSEIVPVTPTAYGQWTGNISATMNGELMTLITEGTPESGEYLVGEWGTYTFSLDDVDEVVTIVYDYAPLDVSWAVTELIGEWYKRKDRIGLLSKTLGGQETVTFSQKDMNDSIRSSLQTYRNVVPV